MICLYMWIEWLSVVYIASMCQKSYVWKMMNNEVVVWWTWNEFMNNCVDDVWKHVVDELVWWIYHWRIDDESCCWCWIILKVWWNRELKQNDVWFMSFEHSCVCVYVHDL